MAEKFIANAGRRARVDRRTEEKMGKSRQSDYSSLPMDVGNVQYRPAEGSKPQLKKRRSSEGSHESDQLDLSIESTAWNASGQMKKDEKKVQSPGTDLDSKCAECHKTEDRHTVGRKKNNCEQSHGKDGVEKRKAESYFRIRVKYSCGDNKWNMFYVSPTPEEHLYWMFASYSPLVREQLIYDLASGDVKVTVSETLMNVEIGKEINENKVTEHLKQIFRNRCNNIIGVCYSSTSECIDSLQSDIEDLRNRTRLGKKAEPFKTKVANLYINENRDACVLLVVSDESLKESEDVVDQILKDYGVPVIKGQYCQLGRGSFERTWRDGITVCQIPVKENGILYLFDKYPCQICADVIPSCNSKENCIEIQGKWNNVLQSKGEIEKYLEHIQSKNLRIPPRHTEFFTRPGVRQYIDCTLSDRNLAAYWTVKADKIYILARTEEEMKTVSFTIKGCYVTDQVTEMSKIQNCDWVDICKKWKARFGEKLSVCSDLVDGDIATVSFVCTADILDAFNQALHNVYQCKQPERCTEQCEHEWKYQFVEKYPQILRGIETETHTNIIMEKKNNECVFTVEGKDTNTMKHARKVLKDMLGAVHIEDLDIDVKVQKRLITAAGKEHLATIEKDRNVMIGMERSPDGNQPDIQMFVEGTEGEVTVTRQKHRADDVLVKPCRGIASVRMDGIGKKGQTTAGFFWPEFVQMDSMFKENISNNLKHLFSLSQERKFNTVFFPLPEFSEVHVVLDDLVHLIIEEFSIFVQNNKGVVSYLMLHCDAMYYNRLANNVTKQMSDAPDIPIDVIQGQLAQLQVDVVVSSVDPFLNLKNGAVSSSLVRVAGPEMEKEAKGTYPRGITHGDIAVTQGYKLPCSFVFHSTLDAWNVKIEGNQMKCVKILRSVIWKCLAEMDHRKLRTIAFPALGTGKLLYPPDVVAKEMFETVERYIKRNPLTGIKKVIFVVFQKDQMYDKFMAEKKRRSEPSEPEGEDKYHLTIVGTERNVGLAKRDLQTQVKCQAIERQLSEVPHGATGYGGGNQPSSSGRMVTMVTEGDQIDSPRNPSPIRPPPPTVGQKGEGASPPRLFPGVQSGHSGKGSSSDRPSQPKPQSPTPNVIFGSHCGPGGGGVGMGVNVAKQSMAHSKRHVEGRAMENQSNKTLIDFLQKPKVKLSSVALKIAEGKESKIQRQIEKSYEEAKVDISDGIVIQTDSLKTIYELRSILMDLLKSQFDEQSDTNSDSEEGYDEDVNEDGPSLLQETLKSYKESTEHSGTIFDVKQHVYQALRYYNKNDILMYEKMDVTFSYYDNKLTIRSRDKSARLKAIEHFQCLIEDVEEFCFIEFMSEKCNADQILAFAAQMKKERHWEDILIYKINEKFVQLAGHMFDDVHKFEGVLKFRCLGKDVQSREGRVLASAATSDIENSDITGVSAKSLEYEDDYQKEKIESPPKRKLPVPPVEQGKVAPPAGASTFHTAEGFTVYVYKKSLLTLDVDCIVNAANSSLKHGGGIAKLISKAAGPQLDHESADYIRNHGHVLVGECCVTTAGRLPYKCVIHAVGPQNSQYKKSETEKLQKHLHDAVFGSLVKAKEQKCYSIGLPSISSGIFAVPKGCCAVQYGIAVKDYSRRYRSGSLKEIHFVDINEDMLQFINVAFDYILNDSASAAVELTKLEEKEVVKRPRFSLNRKKNKMKEEKNSAPDKTEADFTLSRLKIFIKKGDLVDFGEGVIVCSQEKTLNGKGRLAKAVQKLYPNFMKDLRSKYGKTQLKPGNIIVMSPGQHQRCSHIYNVVLPDEKQLRERDPVATVSECYFKALQEAIKSGVRKIALPLMATGSRGTSAEISANCLMTVLIELLESPRPGTELREVHVINDKQQNVETARRVFREYFEADGKQASGRGSSDQRSQNADDYEHVFSTIGETDKLISQRHANLNTDVDQEVEMQKHAEEGIQPDLGISESGEESCPICLDVMEDAEALSKCGHKFHAECIKECFSRKPVCPTCQTVYGKLIGNQPDGDMFVDKESEPLAGYERYQTIVIRYHFPGGIQRDDHPEPGQRYRGTRRTAYLPDSKEGRKVLRLLREAFNRKLVFTIGRSVSTGEDNIVTWNDIHHKTKRYGGAQGYGYPDPDYLRRVQEELATKGVTEDSL